MIKLHIKNNLNFNKTKYWVRAYSKFVFGVDEQNHKIEVTQLELNTKTS